MAMVEPDERFTRAADPEERLRRAEERCLEAEQRCFRAERRRFEAERQREQVQQLLDQARRAGLRMGVIVEELKRLVAHLHDVAERRHDEPAAPQTRSAAAAQTQSATVGQTQSAELDGADMADALTAAIVRLRANVQTVEEHATPAATPPAPAGPPSQERVPHKHSLSWWRRWRNRRKQRASR